MIEGTAHKPPPENTEHIDNTAREHLQKALVVKAQNKHCITDIYEYRSAAVEQKPG